MSKYLRKYQESLEYSYVVQNVQSVGDILAIFENSYLTPCHKWYKVHYYRVAF
mgnify:CR=1 FL=1